MSVSQSVRADFRQDGKKFVRGLGREKDERAAMTATTTTTTTRKMEWMDGEKKKLMEFKKKWDKLIQRTEVAKS